MAVPKKKKSSSRSRMRRGSNGSLDANFPNVTTDKTSGEFKLSHHICKADGSYNGRKVVADKKKKSSQEE
jgi:large subunit ribosomal protein L32